MGVLYGQTVNVKSKLFRKLTDDEAILAQAAELRLGTKRGTYWTDPEYGLLCTDYVNEGVTRETLARIPNEVSAELEKDERIATATVAPTLARTESGAAILLAITIEPVAGPSFDMTLSVDGVSVSLLTRGA